MYNNKRAPRLLFLTHQCVYHFIIRVLWTLALSIFLLPTAYASCAISSCPSGATVITPTASFTVSSGQVQCINADTDLGSNGNITIESGGALHIMSDVTLTGFGVLRTQGELFLQPGADLVFVGSGELGAFGNQKDSLIRLCAGSSLSLTGAFTQNDPSFLGFFPGSESVIELHNNSVLEVCGTFTQQARTYSPLNFMDDGSENAYFITRAPANGGSGSTLTNSSDVDWIALDDIAHLSEGSANLCGPYGTEAGCAWWPDGLTEDSNVCGEGKPIATNLVYPPEEPTSEPFSTDYCVTADGDTGLLELGDMPTNFISGADNYVYTNRVLPGFGTVDVTVNMTGGRHFANTSSIGSGTRQQSWLAEGLPASGTAIHLSPNSEGTATVTYDFEQPTGNVDLLLLDMDEDDTVTITAKDGSGNDITDFSGWRYRSGDLSVWQNPDPVAQPPSWNPATQTLTSTDNANDHRSFGLLTPDTLVTQIIVTYTVPSVSGRDIYSILHSTTTNRDGTTDCPTGAISGTVYADSDGDNTYTPDSEAGISAVTVNLLKATADTVLKTTSTTADGSYRFDDLDSGLTYRLVADIHDPDLPSGFISGTTNPLTGISVAANKTTTEQNFGFDSSILTEISGLVFEDLQYGGGNGRPFGSSGTTGINAARLELYNSSGDLVDSTDSLSSDHQDGSYTLTAPEVGQYYVRVVTNSVSSSRDGSNGSELGVITFRTDGTTDVVDEIGGRNPAVADANINNGTSTLNTTTFTFTGGTLAGEQAQAVQPVNLTGSLEGVNFGFNFNTVVNTNGEGYGSLQQFVQNSNILSSEGIQQQLPTAVSDYSTGDTVAVFMIPENQLTAGEAVINIPAGLILKGANTVIDGRLQVANVGDGDIVIKGDANPADGLFYEATADGSVLREITISDFGGSGVVLSGTGGTVDEGVRVQDVTIKDNDGYGLLLESGASHNQIISSTIATNNWAGIANDADANNTYSQNSLYDNGALGIDLGLDGVTANSNSDSWLNYPEVSAAAGATISSNGTQVVSYDFDIDVPANTDGYRIEFFMSSAMDDSGHGEGETYLGYVDLTHPGTGSENFKGSFDANQAVPAGAYIAVTLTEKTGVDTLGATSEFSGINSGNVVMCTDLASDPDAPLSTVTLGENASKVSYLEAKDADGNPITYIISGGPDSSQFVILPTPPGALLDCVAIAFINSNDDIEESRSLGATNNSLPPGNYEVPMDQGADNTYELTLTATDIHGNTVEKPLTVTIADVNEQPQITTAAWHNVQELQAADTPIIDIESWDPDKDDSEGSGLSYHLSDGDDKAKFRIDSATGQLYFRESPDFANPADQNADNVYELTIRVTDDQGYSSSKDMTITVQDNTDNNGVYLQIKALLQGAYESSTGLMRDTLRTKGVIPVEQPYNREPFNHLGTENINLDLVGVEGNEAMVDWVLLEIRDANNPSVMVASQAVLIQRDGDLMNAASGDTELHLSQLSQGDYHIALRHRNHLGVRTASPVTLSVEPTTIDFSHPDTPVQGEYARAITETQNEASLALLWNGDISQDQKLILDGAGNDMWAILGVVVLSSENSLMNTNYLLPGYQNADLNMDGVTSFVGPGNDVSNLLSNILTHPANDEFVGNFIGIGGLE